MASPTIFRLVDTPTTPYKHHNNVFKRRIIVEKCSELHKLVIRFSRACVCSFRYAMQTDTHCRCRACSLIHSFTHWWFTQRLMCTSVHACARALSCIYHKLTNNHNHSLCSFRFHFEKPTSPYYFWMYILYVSLSSCFVPYFDSVMSLFQFKMKVTSSERYSGLITVFYCLILTFFESAVVLLNMYAVWWIKGSCTFLHQISFVFFSRPDFFKDFLYYSYRI